MRAIKNLANVTEGLWAGGAGIKKVPLCYSLFPMDLLVSLGDWEEGKKEHAGDDTCKR